MWTFKDMNVHLHVQSSKLLVHVSGVHCHMYVSSTSCTFVYFVEQYFIEYSIIISFFQSRRSRRKHKSSGGVADTAEKRFRMCLVILNVELFFSWDFVLLDGASVVFLITWEKYSLELYLVKSLEEKKIKIKVQIWRLKTWVYHLLN